MGDIIIVKECCCKFGCYKIPKTCPKCSKPLSLMKNPPYVLDKPFSLLYAPFSIAIKPTNGYWTDDCDLHIGLTMSNSIVISFNEHGLIQEDFDRFWKGSIVTYRAPGQNMVWVNTWTETINDLSGKQQWAKFNYNENSNNCLDFVIDFLRNVFQNLEKKNIFHHETKEKELYKNIQNRCIFTEKYLLLSVQKTLLYIQLEKNLKQSPYSIFT